MTEASDIIKAPELTPYETWSKAPTPTNLNSVLKDVDSTINSALKTYAPGSASPILRGRAKTMAIQAIKSYDPTKGASLNTHVMRQLQGVGRYASRATQALPLTDYRKKQLAILNKTEDDFYERYGRDASDSELADRLGLSVKKIGKIRGYSSFSTGTSAFGPEAVDPTLYKDDPMDAFLDYVYLDLDDIDRKILDWKTGRNNQPVLKNTEIAKLLKLSTVAISKRAAKIQAKIERGLSE